MKDCFSHLYRHILYNILTWTLTDLPVLMIFLLERWNPRRFPCGGTVGIKTHQTLQSFAQFLGSEVSSGQQQWSTSSCWCYSTFLQSATSSWRNPLVKRQNRKKAKQQGWDSTRTRIHNHLQAPYTWISTDILWVLEPSKRIIRQERRSPRSGSNTQDLLLCPV